MKYFAHHQKEFLYKYVVMQSDVDQFKHMSFANYLKLMFLATDALILGVPDYRKLVESNRLMVYQTRMHFRSQTVFGDDLLIKVNSSNITADRFNLLFTYANEGTLEIVALGKQQLGFTGSQLNDSVNIPPTISNLIEAILVDEENLVYKY